ncbi:PKD domain containing protein [Desulfatibacillum aliphaticivorans]|uniref:PKD domain containing protein n=1 Tax=Desulfatibacillum aliphaticivorans TaxID=218208 RepID=B8FMS7_DESAL|nr:PKD domain-containing protein [Desulfatibacillum aliphaticivorans]ACL01944.1 PKD domain containing protein [Desulfatibacillum aliphaticivorans]
MFKKICYSIVLVFLAASFIACSSSGGDSTSSSDDEGGQTAAVQPDPPQNITFAAGNGKVILDWDDNVQGAVYNIYFWTTSKSDNDGRTKISNVRPPYTHSGLENGRTYHYIVTRKVNGVESGYSQEIIVTPENSAPTAELTGDKEASLGETVSFDAGGSSDPDGDELTYSMDFGDGQSELDQARPVFTHEYAAYGKYTATLTVTDTEGAPATSELEVKCGLFPVTTVNLTPTDFFWNQQAPSTFYDGANLFVAWEAGNIQASRSQDQGASFSQSTEVMESGYWPVSTDIAGYNEDVHIVWYDLYATECLYARSETGGLSFFDWEGISVWDNVGSYLTKVGYDGDQFVMAVWCNTGGGPNHIQCTRSFDNGSFFSEPETLVYPNATGPDVEVVNSTVYLVWIDNNATEYYTLSEIHFSKSPDQGETYSPAVCVSPAPAYSFTPTMKIGPNGEIYVIWRLKPFVEETQTILNEFHTAFARSVDDGSTFQSQVWDFSGRNAMAVSPQGRIFIVWVKEIADKSWEFSLSYSDDQGTSFSGPIPINGIDGYIGSFSIEAFSSNKIAIVYTHFSDDLDGDIICSTVEIP